MEWLENRHVNLGILTNMHVDLDYQTLVRDLPESVRPAYDGMVLEFDI